MSRPTPAPEAGRACLDLQNRARAERRGTQELLTLYVVERWLAGLSASAHADKFVIKGGMLLAAYDARRPTADLDALARSITNDEDAILSLVSDVARLALNDGVLLFIPLPPAQAKPSGCYGAGRLTRRKNRKPGLLVSQLFSLVLRWAASGRGWGSVSRSIRKPASLMASVMAVSGRFQSVTS